MADGIYLTQEELDIAYKAVCFQHKVIPNTEEFLQTIAEVIAYERARSRWLENILHEDLTNV